MYSVTKTWNCEDVCCTDATARIWITLFSSRFNNFGPGDLCAMKACVHASAYLAFIMLSFWALVTYLAVNLWLRGYGYQSKDTLQFKTRSFSSYKYLQPISKYTKRKYATICHCFYAKSVQKQNKVYNPLNTIITVQYYWIIFLIIYTEPMLAWGPSYRAKTAWILSDSHCSSTTHAQARFHSCAHASAQLLSSAFVCFRLLSLARALLSPCSQLAFIFTLS